jgi:hypothetical protein
MSQYLSRYVAELSRVKWQYPLTEVDYVTLKLFVSTNDVILNARGQVSNTDVSEKANIFSLARQATHGL